jgi:ankyrin repeat protein
VVLDLGCPCDYIGGSGGGDGGGATPLIIAAYCRKVGVVQGLVERGANVNAVDADGYTALMWACFKGEEQVGSILIDSHADVSLASKVSNTALIYAAYANSEANVMRLLEMGASPLHLNEKSLKAADVAFQQGHHALASLLKPIKRDA